MPNAIDPYRKRSYIPEGCDQQGRLETGLWQCTAFNPQGCYRVRCQLGGVCVEEHPKPPDDWDAAGVAEEGKSGTRMIGWLMVSVVFVGICAAVAYIVVDLVRMP